MQVCIVQLIHLETQHVGMITAIELIALQIHLAIQLVDKVQIII